AATLRAEAAGPGVVAVRSVSTDMLYHAPGVFSAAGVVFTASHNPAGYNGTKMTRAPAVPISFETGLAEIQTLAQTYLHAGYLETDRLGTVTHRDTLSDYARYLRDLV